MLFVACDMLPSAAEGHSAVGHRRRLDANEPATRPDCAHCGREGRGDFNCCHPGGAWAGLCGDDGMVKRGAAKFTYAEGFTVCQERWKYFRSFDPFHQPRSKLARASRFELLPPRAPVALSPPPATPAATSVCMLHVQSRCSVHPDASKWNWFDDSVAGGPSNPTRRACRARARAWEDGCGLGATVLFWHVHPTSFAAATATAPIMSGSGLQQCLATRGSHEGCEPAPMWPSVARTPRCPTGWTWGAIGVCYNESYAWRCPARWTTLDTPPFCSMKGHATEPIPRLRCYAVRHRDLHAYFCADSACDWTGLARHYLQWGQAELRALHCDANALVAAPPGLLVATALPARHVMSCGDMEFTDSVGGIGWKLDVMCYLQRYGHVRQRFCAPNQLANQCIAHWTDDNYCAVLQQFESMGRDQGLRFACDRTGSVPVSMQGLQPGEMRSLKVVIPGHGAPARTPLLLNSIDTLKRNAPANVRFSCTIYVYNTSLEVYPKGEEFPRTQQCDVVVQPGLWTDFMRMERGSSDYVLVMMDDVAPFNIDLGTMLQAMEQHHIDELSPSILPSWNWKNMNQGRGALLKRVRMTDTLLAVFKRHGFECWKSLIDSQANRFGWGYDVSFSTRCNASVAVSDQHLALHATGVGGSVSKERLYNETETFGQMWRYLRKSMGWKFDTHEQGMQLLIAHNDAAPASVVPAPGLALLDPSYLLEVEHRGGWRAVIQHAIRQGVLSVNNRGGQPMLIDCAEKWFIWGGQREPWEDGVREPWVGMIHSTPNLPPSYPKKETLQGLLATPSFVASVPWCRLIIVFSDTLAQDLRLLLPSVRVAVLRHPIGMEASDAGRLFSAARFQERRGQWEVVFLGQQYRRLSTLTRLQVPYRKVWLPGSVKENNESFLVKHSRDEEAARPDLSSFRIAYMRSHEEYDWMLLHNIVVIDVWDASANNAVLEAIGMNNPIHVNKHPAIVEYLGSDYPLYFSDVNSLQALLRDESALLHWTRLAHQHLVALPKNHLSLDHFASELNRTIAALG